MDVHQTIRLRRSVRHYDPTPIPADSMDRLRQALRFAPSACNIQPWRFVLVTDPAARTSLAKAAKDQMFIAEAPLVVVACGNPADAYPRMAGRYSSLDMDLAIALDHLTLAAVAEGLGTCWIGAFAEPPVHQLLGIPDDIRVVAMMPVGYPADPKAIHAIDPNNRKAESEIFCDEKWT